MNYTNVCQEKGLWTENRASGYWQRCFKGKIKNVFSSEVKQELAKQSGKSRHCQIAELAALVAFDGKRQQLIGDAGDVLDSENPLLQEKYGLLLAQLFHVNIEEIDTLPLERILETIKMWNQSLRCADITETVMVFTAADMLQAGIYPGGIFSRWIDQ